MSEIYPSLLSIPENEIEKYVKQLEPVCPGFHMDVMDSVFVPNTGISIEKINTVSKITYRPLWIHLMVEHPEFYLDELQMPPDSIVTFHTESKKDFSGTITKIIEKKWLPGIAIKPKTGINEVFPFLEVLYQVLIMSVEPGLSGQVFLEETLAKVEPLLGYRQTRHLNFKIAMDGGINASNIATIAQKGVDQLAVGSTIFDAKVGALKAYHLLNQLIN